MSRKQPALAELSVPRLSVDSVKMSSGLRFGQQEMVMQTQHRRHNRRCTQGAVYPFPVCLPCKQRVPFGLAKRHRKVVSSWKATEKWSRFFSSLVRSSALVSTLLLWFWPLVKPVDVAHWHPGSSWQRA